MSTPDLRVRGYAAAFDENAKVDGLIESIAPGAFDLSSRPEFLFGGHRGHRLAAAGDRSILLFQDAFGLGFEVCLPADQYARATLRAIHAERLGASVNFTSWETDEAVRDPGQRRIVRASIDHVAILGQPVYAGTCCWVVQAELDDALPHGLKARARTWAAGLQASIKIGGQGQATRSAAGPIAAVRRQEGGVRRSASLSALTNLLADPEIIAAARASEAAGMVLRRQREAGLFRAQRI